MSTDWASVIGQAIERQRERAGLKWASLADRTRDLGRPVHRVALGKLERGERDISVPELIGIAAALGIPPLALLFPDVTSELELLPGKPMAGLSALGWFIGAGGNIGLAHDYAYTPDGVATTPAMRIPLRMLKIEDALIQQRHSLLQCERPIKLGMVDNPTALEDMQREAEVRRQTIKNLEAERDRLIEEYRKSCDA